MESKDTMEQVEPKGETIDTTQVTPITKADCQHELILEEEDSGIPGHVTYKCRFCPYGVISKKP